MQTLQHLKVFLASPSDLKAERSSAEEVVNEVNRLTRVKGWYVDLYKWEDIPPAYGRPQAQINLMVDQCDIFVGLLWERWGQPSGAYSSGFEEEFERAVASCKTQQKPDIWLFFKDIDSAKLGDPGDQLRNVVAFRDLQRESNELLFKQVRNTEDWTTQFRVSLLSYIFSVAVPAIGLGQQPTSSVLPFETPSMSAVDSASQTNIDRTSLKQLITLSSTLNRAFEAGAFQFSSVRENPLQEFDVSRLFLLASTLMSQGYTNEALGVHEINLLYKHREKLEASDSERLQLLRAIVADKSNVKPGWFWFRDFDEQALVHTLLERATQDSDDDVRIGALDLMALARMEITQTLWPTLPWNHKSYVVKKSALDYLAAVGDQNALEFLESIVSDDTSLFSSALKAAKTQLLSRLDPDKALSEVIAQDQYITDEQLEAVPLEQVGEQTLFRGTESQWGNIRQLCAEELSRRGRVGIDLATRLTEDEFVAVKALGFQALATLGVLPGSDIVRKALSPPDKEGGNIASFLSLLGKRKAEPDVDSIVTTYFKTLTTERLSQMVDWYSLDGRLAYAALAEDRFETFGETLRSDLASGFDRVREESIKRQEEEFGPKVREWIKDKWADLEDFIKSQFTRAALSGLAKHAEAQDAALARPYLDRTDSWVRDPAITIIAKVGTSEDVVALLRIAKEAFGGASTESAAAALALSSEPLKIASVLMSSDKSGLVKTALHWLYNRRSADNNEIFEMFLQDEDATRREQALDYLYRSMENSELRDLLKHYIENNPYFYNVVAWLDKLLYAPPILKDVFARNLKGKTKY